MAKQTYDNYYREYFKKNKEKIKILRQTKYREKEIVRSRRWAANYRKKQPKDLLLWRSVKGKCHGTDTPFTIEVSDIIIPEICPVLGIKLCLVPDKDKREAWASVDRIIPALGYVKGNIQVISLKANMLKSNHTLETLELIKNYILTYGPKEITDV